MNNQNTLVGWTDAQWGRVLQAVEEEANRASVAGDFLPCFGPLEASAEVVREDKLDYQARDNFLRVDDVDTLDLWTLTVHVHLKQQQLAEDNLTGALVAFRRAANLIARAEDAIVFQGYDKDRIPRGVRVTGGENQRRRTGILGSGIALGEISATPKEFVHGVGSAIMALEADGHLGPFACIMGQQAFIDAHTPMPDSMVMPSDRMEPMLGRPLLRSSTLPDNAVVVVSLAGDPIDLVVATAPTVQFLHVNEEARYVFRVYERFVPRIKERDTVCSFMLQG
jgi:uncharacterized linocin/CFP29 family protein